MSNERKNLLQRCFANKSLSREEILERALEMFKNGQLNESDYGEVVSFIAQ